MNFNRQLQLETCHGHAIAEHLAALAQLRMQVFREFPYLYVGDLDYETRYLQRYSTHRSSIAVLVFDGRNLVGASTGVALQEDEQEFQEPFAAKGIAVESVFYFGESLVLPGYRGRGLGHHFFDRREAHARDLACTTTAFCSVIRAADDPRRPQDYHSPESLWRKRGYQPILGMICHYHWQEIGDAQESDHRLQFWVRHWPGKADVSPGSQP